MQTFDPPPEELAVIEAEWPVVTAELAVVAAECRLAASGDVVSVRAHRRAVAALARVVRARSWVRPLLPDTAA
ncbi:MAG: hypothetical protein ACRCSN_15765 [Dermatophilaceae bacterium]